MDLISKNGDHEILSFEDNSEAGASHGLDKMTEKDYCPPEVVVELAKCVLGMLHYRILSWA